MKEILIDVIKAGVPLSLMAIMFSQGLRLAPGEQWEFFRQRLSLMLRSFAVVLVLVPLTTLAVILLFNPPMPIVICLSILAASPAAPFQLLVIFKKGGSLVYLATLHVSLALLAIVTVPVVLSLLSKVLGFEAEVSAGQVAWTVGKALLAPVLAGLAFRSLWPELADRIGPTLGKVAEIMLYVMALPILAKFHGVLLQMELSSYFVMAVFVVVNLSLGHLLGPTEPEERTVLTMESGARNVGLAMAIGALNFTPERVLPVLIPYIILFVVISTIYLNLQKRSATT